MGAYEDSYRRSLTDPEGFWLDAAEAISWTKPPTRALDDSAAPLYRWFPDGELNTSYNALDRHLEAGHGDRTALIYDSPMTGTTRSYTYAELTHQVAVFAGALKSLGVGAGDRVIVYLPMVPEAVVTMLACARLGAIHSVVFGGFAPKELAARIDDARPKVIVAASCGIEPTRIVEYLPIIEEALTLSEYKPERTIVLQREIAPAKLGERDLDWASLVSDAQPADPVPVAATDPRSVRPTSASSLRAVPRASARLRPNNSAWYRSHSSPDWPSGYPALSGRTPTRRRIAVGRVCGTPATVNDPLSGDRIVVSIRIAVVFPAPLGPRKPSTVPAATRSSSDSTATSRPYDFRNPLASSATSAGMLIASLRL